MLENEGKPALLIAALWTIGAAEGRELPNYRGVLDSALNSIKDQLPTDVAEHLTFSVTAVGLRCLELPQIINDMQYLMLADISVNTSIKTCTELDQAYRMLYEQGVGLERANLLAQKFYSAVSAECDS